MSALPEGEAALQDRLRAGDPEAGLALLREHGPRLLAAARRLIPGEQKAIWAVSEAVAALLGDAGLEGGPSLTVRLHRTLLEVALQTQHRLRVKETPIEELLPRFLEDGHHAGPVVEWSIPAPQVALPTVTLERVRSAIDELPLAHRAVLVWIDLVSIAPEEVAQILGLTPSETSRRLHHARLALRTRLEPIFARSASPSWAPALGTPSLA